jgi:4-diphosphocytidyl-2-C-methyl-D-erythritol kinase
MKAVRIQEQFNMSSNASFHRQAPAKINLHLEITGRRADGYHDITTIFHPLPWLSDDIELQVSNDLAGKIETVSNSTEIPLDERNICHKAAASFAELAEITPSWRISIKKRIPVAAGLGGGSSDAAAVLKLLNENVCEIREHELRGLALSIGADVPFFLDPKPAIGRGLGELLEPIETSCELRTLLVDPLFPVSAKWAYTHLKENSNPNERHDIASILTALRSGRVEMMPKEIRNDLATALLEKFPLLKILLDELADAGATTRGISGSGPTIFAIFADDDALLAATEKLTTKHGKAIRCLHHAETEVA